MVFNSYRLPRHLSRPVAPAAACFSTQAYERTASSPPPPPHSSHDTHSHPHQEHEHHSEAHSDEAPSSGINPKEILHLALDKVPAHGWTTEALSAAAVELGLSPAAGSVFTPMDLVYHFMDVKLDQLHDDAPHLNLDGLDVEDRIGVLMQRRISYLAPVIKHWAAGMALGATPVQLPETTAKLWRLVSEICYLAGDREAPTSPHFYARRSLLLSLYTAAESFALTDKSADLTDTQHFVARRFEEMKTARNYGSTAFTAVSSLASAIPSMGIGGSLFQTPFGSSTASSSSSSSASSGASASHDEHHEEVQPLRAAQEAAFHHTDSSSHHAEGDKREGESATRHEGESLASAAKSA